MEHVLCMLDNKGKNADTHSECVILLAFPWQEWLDELPQCYVYMHIACLLAV